MKMTHKYNLVFKLIVILFTHAVLYSTVHFGKVCDLALVVLSERFWVLLGIFSLWLANIVTFN